MASRDEKLAAWLSQEITPLAPIVPVVACAAEDEDIAYREALPVAADATSQFISARLSAALRARSLHGSVIRRAAMAQADGHPLPDVPRNDPLDDATVIVAGRGRAYPALSVAIGERAGAIGTLSIETAARYLKSRDTDGLVLGDGFGPRNVEAFLIAVSEDTRYRDLPIGVLGNVPLPDVETPNIVTAADPARLAARILPYVRLHAFEERLRRILQSFDHNGIIDPATGLLRTDVFIRDLERAIKDAGERSTGLSVARFVVRCRYGSARRNGCRAPRQPADPQCRFRLPRRGRLGARRLHRNRSASRPCGGAPHRQRAQAHHADARTSRASRRRRP